MIKAKYFFLVITCFIFVTDNVCASEFFYSNNNGVNLNQEEYNYIVNMVLLNFHLFE